MRAREQTEFSFVVVDFLTRRRGFVGRWSGHQVAGQIIEFGVAEAAAVIGRHQGAVLTIKAPQVGLLEKVETAILGLQLNGEVVFVTNESLQALTTFCRENGRPVAYRWHSRCSDDFVANCVCR